MQREYKKQNWRYVDIQLRDERLLRVIGDEGFIRRDLVIKYIFDGNESYAKIRIRKLKKFGYLNAVPVKAFAASSGFSRYVVANDDEHAYFGQNGR